MTNSFDGMDIDRIGADDIARRSEIYPEMGLLKIAEPVFGFGGTEVFTGADRVLQGLAVATVDGVETLFYLSRVAGGTFEDDERHRIAWQAVPSSTGPSALAGWTGELALGHQGLTALYHGDDLYLYTQAVNPDPSDTVNAGKGFARVLFNGTDTDQGDVESYQLFGDFGSGHRFAAFRGASVCVSTDGRFLILIATDNQSVDAGETATGIEDTVNWLFVYDLASVLAAVDPLTVNPLFWRKMAPPSYGERLHYVQGIASDGQRVWVQRGYYAPRQRQVVAEFDIAGSLIREIDVDGARAAYSVAELEGSGALGVASSFEPEGVALRADGTLVGTWMDEWRTPDSVVTFEGAAFACIVATDTFSPRHELYWAPVPQTDPAYPAWVSGTSYAPGARTRKSKTVWAIVPRDAATHPISAGKALRASGASLTVRSNAVDASWRVGENMTFATYSELTGTYYPTVTLTSRGGIRGYDAREGSDSSQNWEITGDFSASREIMQLRARGVTADGAGINLYGLTDSNGPGALALGAAGNTGFDLWIEPATGGRWVGNSDQGQYYTRRPLPSLSDGDFTAGVRYLLLGLWASADFALAGKLFGGRLASQTTHSRFIDLDIATYYSSGDGGIRNVAYRLAEASNTTDAPRLARVTYAGQDYLALHVNSPTVPQLRAGYFTGSAKGFAPQWVNQSAVTVVSVPDGANVTVTHSGAHKFMGAVSLTAPGPFADDTAAAAGGVAVGELYRVTGGSTAWRQV
jgi:hypothetical protein